MRICPQCRTEQDSEFTSHCSACGYQFEDATQTKSDFIEDEGDDLEFQVLETAGDDRDLVGEERRSDGISGGMEEEEAAEQEDDLRTEEGLIGSGSMSDSGCEQIGSTAAFIPEPEDIPPQASPDSTDFSDLASEEGGDSSESESSTTDSGGIRKLSEEEVESISSSLYHNDSYLSDRDKSDLMEKLNEEPRGFSNTPIEIPKSDEKPKRDPKEILDEFDESLPRPRMAQRGKGIAYFYKNFIQLSGNQHLTPGDEITIGNRHYELRPKSISRTARLVGSGVLFVLLLLFIGSFFISSTGGDGQLAGIILDEYDQPFLKGGQVRFPNLGETFDVDAQGLFQSGIIPTGTHKVEFLLDGEVIGADYATVVGGQLSMLIIRPELPEEYASVPEKNISGNTEPQTKQSSAPATSTSKPQSSPPPSPQPKQEPKPKPAPTKSRPALAALTLKANVDQATVKLGGDVIGAGNLTYRNIRPGTYRYEISRDGYESATGTVELSPGKARSLAVELVPLTQAAREETYTAEDFYFSGLSAIQERDFKAAVKDLNEAARRKPGDPDVQFALGQAWTGIKDWYKARDAYLRAAEQYRFKDNHSRAITAYNEAIQADDEAVPAYLGRGELFLARGDERAALIDFESVVRIDRRNPQAYFGMGKARFKQGMYDKAVKHLKDAQSLDSDNVKIHEWLMLASMADKDLDEVKKAYEKFVEVASDEQISDFHSDKRFAAVIRVIETERQ